MRRITRTERFLQTIETFSHDTADTDDRRAGHLFIQQPVCRTPNPDPRDFSPLHFPDNHRAPEALRRFRRETDIRDRDRTQRWLELTEAALLLAALTQRHGDEEALRRLAMGEL